MRKTFAPFLLLLLILVGPALACGSSDEATPEPTQAANALTVAEAQVVATQSMFADGRQQATVTNIVDGDTIDATIDGETKRIRYILMNTPERGETYGSEATAKNSELVMGKTVYLEKDVSETDRYNRLLRYVYLADGTMVNRELVRLGFAQVATFPPDVKYEAEIRAAQTEATEASRGLWGLNEGGGAAATGAVANSGANLREGPAVIYPTVGGVAAGNPLVIVARNDAGDWYKLDSGAWIAAFLVDGAPGDLPVAAAPAPPATSAPAVVPVATSPPAAPARQNCHPAYPGVCIPPPPPDLDCGEITFRRFQVLAPDPHRFDNDNDGIGCESG